MVLSCSAPEFHPCVCVAVADGSGRRSCVCCAAGRVCERCRGRERWIRSGRRRVRLVRRRGAPRAMALICAALAWDLRNCRSSTNRAIIPTSRFAPRFETASRPITGTSDRCPRCPGSTTTRSQRSSPTSARFSSGKDSSRTHRTDPVQPRFHGAHGPAGCRSSAGPHDRCQVKMIWPPAASS